MSLRKALQLVLPLPFREREFVSPARAVLEGAIVPYTIKRSLNRRRISLRIDETGLRVGAPIDASQRAIDKVLDTHSAWVAEKLREWAGRTAPVARWVDGATLMLRGNPVVLRCAADVRTAAIRGETIVAPAANTERHVVMALKTEALACYRQRVAHYCDVLGAAHPDVKLSTARTRWGSCHSAGRIFLNWRMIQMPMSLVDYVVAHEVAHLREMNHSPRFWAVVGSLVPDYKQLRQAIRREGHRYLVV